MIPPRTQTVVPRRAVTRFSVARSSGTPGVVRLIVPPAPSPAANAHPPLTSIRELVARRLSQIECAFAELREWHGEQEKRAKLEWTKARLAALSDGRTEGYTVGKAEGLREGREEAVEIIAKLIQERQKLLAGIGSVTLSVLEEVAEAGCPELVGRALLPPAIVRAIRSVAPAFEAELRVHPSYGEELHSVLSDAPFRLLLDSAAQIDRAVLKIDGVEFMLDSRAQLRALLDLLRDDLESEQLLGDAVRIDAAIPPIISGCP